MQTKTKQQGATQAQLAYRERWLRLGALGATNFNSALLDAAHRQGAPVAVVLSVGNSLLDVMAEAGL